MFDKTNVLATSEQLGVCDGNFEQLPVVVPLQKQKQPNRSGETDTLFAFLYDLIYIIYISFAWTLKFHVQIILLD